MPAIDLSILNQRQTPAFYADVFANRPAAGFVGRIFVSTNTFAFYRDNGTGWDLIGGPGTGTITGSGTAGTVPLWNGASTIGDSTLIEGSTKFTTTKDIQADAVYLNGMTAGNGILYYQGSTLVLANYNASGQVKIEANGGQAAQIIASDLSTTFYGNIIRNGGTSSQFLKADGSLDSNTYNTGSGVVGQVSYFNGINSITGSNDLFWDSINGHFGIGTNVPGTALDVHHDQPTVAILNQTVATNDVRIGFQNNGVGLWRIGAFYNAGANDFGIYDAVAAIQPVTVKKTTGQVLIGTSTVGSGKLVVASTNSDNGVQIVGASAPSLRIDNAESGPTKRAGFGISTATNNFIQGSADRDFCMFNGSTTASPIIFGIYDTTNVQEAARISAARNFIVGKTTDSGERLQVSGTALISSTLTADYLVSNGGGQINTTVSPFVLFNSGGGFNAKRFALSMTNLDTLKINSLNDNGSIRADNIIIANIDGNVGVGTSTPPTKFVVRGSGGNTNLEFDNGANFSYIQSYDRVSSTHRDLYFYATGTPTMILKNTGNLLIGTTTDIGAKLLVNGNFIALGNAGSNAILSRETVTSTAYGFFNSGIGTLVLTDSGVGNVGSFNMATGIYTATSDKNKKKNFEQSNIGLEAVLKLKPTLYNMISQSEHEAKELGFIAQEVKEVIEQAYVQNGEFIGLNYQPIVAALVKAIQDLNTKIENLK
jgi:hypothetical protein